MTTQTLPPREAQPASSARHAQPADVVLHVPDITCGHCANVIKRTLGEAPGVRRVRVDVSARLVHVQHDARVISVDAMSVLLAKENYPVAAVDAAGVVSPALEMAAPNATKRGCPCCA